MSSAPQVDADAHGAVAKRDNSRIETCYKPLDTSRNEIRLLAYRVLAWDELPGIKVECMFKVVALDDQPVFEALSYTWGPPLVDSDWKPLDEFIYFNGHRLQIKGTLFDALLGLYLYRRGSADGALLYLWADALCINQDDVTERNSQVSLMASIYSRAKTVRIWLGDIYSESSRVDTFFRAVKEGNILEHLASEDKDCLAGLKQVVSRSWWLRTWVIQEALLAKNAVVHCGAWSISWTVLFPALLSIRRRVIESRFQQAKMQDLGVWAIYTLTCAYSFDHVEALHNEADVYSIVRLIFRLSRLGVSDNRDRIYGVLGLLPRSLNIRPSYDLCVVDVYRLFVERFIGWSKSLDILLLCNTIDGSTGWPSWIPDFSRGMQVTSEPDSRACGTASCLAHIRKGTNLFVQAHIVDEIAFVHQFGALDETTFLTDVPHEQNRESLRLCYEAAVYPFNLPDFDPYSRTFRFWHAIQKQIPPVAVETTGTVSFKDEDRALVQELDSWLFGNIQSLSVKAQMFIKDIQNLKSGTSFGVSSRGHMMFSMSGKPRQGDQIAIIAGCSMPMVLRSQPESEQPLYRVVTSAFCDGVMQGEYIQQAVRQCVHAGPSIMPGGPLAKLLKTITILHGTSMSYLRAPVDGVVMKIMSQTVEKIPDRNIVDSGSHDDGKTKVAIYEAIETDIRKLFDHERESPTIAGIVQSRLGSSTNRECYLYVTVMCLAFLHTSTLYDGLPLLSQLTEEKSGVLEGILCATGVVIFEVLLMVERSRHDARGSDRSVRSQMLDRAIRRIVLSENLPEDSVGRVFYHQLRNLAEEEVAIERLHNTLFSGLILV